jgi:hypothetical protein
MAQLAGRGLARQVAVGLGCVWKAGARRGLEGDGIVGWLRGRGRSRAYGCSPWAARTWLVSWCVGLMEAGGLWIPVREIHGR